jgi:hypothetical protein
MQDENEVCGGRVKRINLALQGGGAHGAFTWGVLDTASRGRRDRDRGDLRHLGRAR